MNFDVSVNGRPWRVAIEPADTPGQVQVSIKGRRRAYDVSWLDASTLSLIPLEGDPRGREFGIRCTGAGEVQIETGRKHFQATVLPDGKLNQRHPHRVERAEAPMEGRQNVITTMPGRIVRLLVSVGDRVAVRQAVVVVEAMKMENEMRAPKDGVVREVRVSPGDAIDAGAVLLVID